jgi:hypothetical protein
MHQYKHYRHKIILKKPAETPKLLSFHQTLHLILFLAFAFDLRPRLFDIHFFPLLDVAFSAMLAITKQGQQLRDQ